MVLFPPLFALFWPITPAMNQKMVSIGEKTAHNKFQKPNPNGFQVREKKCMKATDFHFSFSGRGF
jgi:hypothetical protein